MSRGWDDFQGRSARQGQRFPSFNYSIRAERFYLIKENKGFIVPATPFNGDLPVGLSIRDDKSRIDGKEIRVDQIQYGESTV